MKKAIVLLGRFFFSWIFISSSFDHFKSSTAAYASLHGVPMASILVPFSGILALLGGISVLLGYKAKFGALLLILFLVPVTLTMHNWWAVSDPMMRQMQHIMFHKNLAMLGGAMLITYFGSGPCSIDSWIASRPGK
jgi:putative oxidoreductase